MTQYAREIAFLLHGSARALGAALALCFLTAAMDMACMVLLPVFLLVSLGATASLAGPLALLVGDWLPGYAGLAGIVVAVFLLRGVLGLYVAGRLTRLSERIRATLTQRLASHYLTCPFQEFKARSVAWAQTVIGSYTGTFATSVALPLLRLLLDVVTMLAIFGFLMLVDHRVVSFAALTLGVVGVGYYLSVRRVTAAQSRRVADLQASFGQQLSRALHAPREVRVFQLQPHFLAGLDEALRQGAEANARLTMIASMPRALGELTLIGLAVAYLVYRTSTGVDSAVMVSQLGLLAFAGLRLLPAFAFSLGHVAALRAGRHATGLLARELGMVSQAAAAPPAASAMPAGERFESLELRDVAFTYPGAGQPVFEHVDLVIRRGESVGVVGGSGAGKSTIGDLILGLLAPTAGRMLVNGRDVHPDNAAWWRMVGFVPQAVFLANDTLLRNIAFGVPDERIARDRVASAVRLAQLDDVVAGLPRGIDSVIGDYGARLSGGQRQRVAIARALYHERQFLVLDEATSALDTETEQAIVQAVASLRGSITTFIIAHRRSTLDGCDTIIEVRDGGIGVQRPPAAATAAAS